MEALELVEVRKAAVERDVAKLRAKLDTAEAELAALKVTAETLNRLSLNPTVDTALPRGQSARAVMDVIPDEQADAMSPKDIHDALTARGTIISPDNVRTILGRYKDRFSIAEGRYWKRPDVPVSTDTEGEA